MNYFYLVVWNYDELTFVRKIFLNKKEAIKYGRAQATQAQLEGWIYAEYVLYRQPITKTGTLERVCTLEPFKK